MKSQPGSIELVTRLSLAEAVTRTGDSITLVALPLTAVLALEASAGELALVGLAQALPIVFLSIPMGAWVDRRSRRWPLLIASDLARAALLLVVPIAALTGMLSLELLVVVAFLVASAGTVFDLAFAGWLPRVLNGDALHTANARVELARSSALVVGPGIAGGLVSWLSAPITLVADALSFVGSAALIGSARRAEPRFEPDPTPRRMRNELTAGIAFLRRERLVAAVVATITINNFSRNIALAIAILYLIEVAALAPAAVAIAFGLGNTGFLAGALVARRLTNRIGMGPTMQLGVGLFGPSMLLLALSPPSLAAATFTLMLFANGFGIAVHNVNQVTVRQVLTPDRLRARVVSVIRLFGFGAVPLGTLAGGLIGEVAGLRAALVVSAIGLAAGSLPYMIVRVSGIRSVESLAAADATAEPRVTASA